MDAYGHKLRQFLAANNIEAEQLSFDQSCHSVAEAAVAVGTGPENFVKNICMTDTHGRVIVAIVKGEDRASTSRVAKALQTDRVRTMTPDEMLATTGYPCGGTPSFGFAATFLIDSRVMQTDEVYTGGGSETTLVRVSPQVLLQANGGRVTRIRK
jgi:prolyl-tRNA editing enzyme YbaK/EbsC (Cys-tRNA(Pro) deacylase)